MGREITVTKQLERAPKDEIRRIAKESAGWPWSVLYSGCKDLAKNRYRGTNDMLERCGRHTPPRYETWGTEPFNEDLFNEHLHYLMSIAENYRSYKELVQKEADRLKPLNERKEGWKGAAELRKAAYEAWSAVGRAK
jgi:hypothetical protein